MENLSDIAYAPRLVCVREIMKKKKLDGFLVTDMTNIRYLTGFSGSSGFLFMTDAEQFFATDFRYQEQSEQEVRGWDIVIERGSRIGTMKNLFRRTCIRKLGFESSVSYEFYRQLSRKGLEIIATDHLVEGLRTIKNDAEIEFIKRAVNRAEEAFLDVKPFIRLGIRERSIATRLGERLRKRGCRNVPFEIIVASGSQSALPHARPTDKKLQEGDLVIIDWGGEANGYYSDMTRTLLIRGKNTGRQQELYQIVLAANRKAISSVTPGVKSKQIDNAARAHIRDSGYGDQFGHGTGHGVGLQIHESPRISWNKSVPLREHMVFTIEPGIYLPGLGGVRIEDMVVVRKKTPEVLTSLKKDLEII